MLRRPSYRRKNDVEVIELNLVPLMDALVTLIIFLIVGSTFVKVAEIESPAPLVSHTPTDDVQNNKVPLQLTIWMQKEQLVVEAGLGGIINKQIGLIENQDGILDYDFEQYRQTLIELKLKHPKDKIIILKPDPEISYDAIIQLIDKSRYFEVTDPPLYIKDAEGIDIKETNLFPKVVFGNTMS